MRTKLSTKRTPVKRFSDSVTLPGDRERHAGNAVKDLLAWRQATCIEDIDPALITKFDEHLTARGMPKSTRVNRIEGLKRLVQLKYPYRFLWKTPWEDCPFAREAPGQVGNYYATVMDAKIPSKGARQSYRAAVRAFLEWCGGPIHLERITEQMLAEFEAWLQATRKATYAPKHYRQFIRKIVNHWSPGRLATLAHASPPPKGKKDEVLRFVQTVFLAGEVRKHGNDRVYITNVWSVLRRLKRFAAGRPLTFALLDREGDKIPKWLVANGNDGQPSTVKTVNNRDRRLINQITEAAAAAGKMRRPLRLKRLPEPKKPKRMAKPSTNGEASGNEKAGKTKAAVARPSQTTQKSTPKRKDSCDDVCNFVVRYKRDHPEASNAIALEAYSAATGKSAISVDALWIAMKRRGLT